MELNIFKYVYLYMYVFLFRVLYKCKIFDVFNWMLSGDGLNLDCEIIYSQILVIVNVDCVDSIGGIVNDYVEKVVNDGDCVF